MSTTAAPEHGLASDTAGGGRPSARPRRGLGSVLGLIKPKTSTLAGIGVVEARGDEHFLPVTRHALVDRLTKPHVWPPGTADDVRRFFRYLEYWRQQRHATRLMHVVEAYEAFSPDSDLFVTRAYTEAERREMKETVVAGVEALVRQANYKVVPRDKVVTEILSSESHYGLDLKVDFDAFEELILCYRGESVTKSERRVISQFFRRQEFEVPIYRRMLLLFKLKPLARHVTDVAAQRNITHAEAERIVKASRNHIPSQINPDNIYIKIFKNIPKFDVEMVFPNTEVKFRLKDKVWLGVTGGGAVAGGMVGAAGKLALAFSNPITAAGALGGLGMVLFRQIMNVMNQKQRYMKVLAENLYFHAMADNRGAITKLADRAAEEDFKEEILLYSVLAKEQVKREDLPEVDKAIQAYIERTFGLQVDFEVEDALERLLADGLVTETADGTLVAKPPADAAHHIDAMWDKILDALPDTQPTRGREVDRTPPSQTVREKVAGQK